MTRLNRQWLTLKLLDEIDVETFFELGFGGGDMMIALAERGLHGYGIELSEDVVEGCRQRIKARGLEDRIQVEQRLLGSIEKDSAYDLGIAFEVLEHMVDDAGALAHLHRLLRPRGHLLVSVPAQMRQWGPSDVWAGHVRRYEREELHRKVEEAGFTIRRFWSLGFPLLRLTRSVRNIFYGRDIEHGKSVDARTQASGVSRPPIARTVEFAVPAVSWLDYQLQRPFLMSDWGESYFVHARRKD